MIHVVGANPRGGGVLTFIKNLSHAFDKFKVYELDDYIGFFRSLSAGDVVFLNVVKPSLPFFLLARFKCSKNVNIIYCGHGLNFRYYMGLKKYLVKLCEFFLSKFSDQILVLNNKDLAAFSSWNKRSVLIPTALKPIHPLSTRRNLDWEHISWVAVGSVEERKDPRFFISIAREVIRVFPEDSFTWIGDGPFLSELDVAALGKERIVFKGGMSNNKVREELHSHHIFICTSQYEVLPISILEAVEAECIILTRNYFYSDDITSRFSSSMGFDNPEQVLDIRKCQAKLDMLMRSARLERGKLEDAYTNYANQVRDIFCE